MQQAAAGFYASRSEKGSGGNDPSERRENHNPDPATSEASAHLQLAGAVRQLLAEEEVGRLQRQPLGLQPLELCQEIGTHKIMKCNETKQNTKITYKLKKYASTTSQTAWINQIFFTIFQNNYHEGKERTKPTSKKIGS